MDDVDIQSDEDDDEDYRCEEYDCGNELYYSKLDDLNEVLFFRDALVQI